MCLRQKWLACTAIAVFALGLTWSVLQVEWKHKSSSLRAQTRWTIFPVYPFKLSREKHWHMFLYLVLFWSSKDSGERTYPARSICIFHGPWSWLAFEEQKASCTLHLITQTQQALHLSKSCISAWRNGWAVPRSSWTGWLSVTQIKTMWPRSPEWSLLIFFDWKNEAGEIGWHCIILMFLP